MAIVTRSVRRRWTMLLFCFVFAILLLLLLKLTLAAEEEGEDAPKTTPAEQQNTKIDLLRSPSTIKEYSEKYSLSFVPDTPPPQDYRYTSPVIRDPSVVFQEDPYLKGTVDRAARRDAFNKLSLAQQLETQRRIRQEQAEDGDEKRSYNDNSRVYLNSMPIATTMETKAYFSDIFVILMMSPSRYHLVDLVRQHYAPYFTHMYFCGPRDRVVDGIHIVGYNIIYGNEQYRAVRDIIREVLRNSTTKTTTNAEGRVSLPPYAGFLYICDDLLFQPWSVAAGFGYNKNIPWSTGMGVANLMSDRPVNAVPAMSIQGKYRSFWPYFRKNRRKMLGALEEGGLAMREALHRAFQKTHPLTLKWSKFKRPPATHEGAARDAAVPPPSVMFYTIVDTYYVPWRHAEPYAQLCDLMAKHWLFGECAIATSLKALSPVHETIQIQFYWSSLSAADCHRFVWTPDVDGFHRCRHDHWFANWMYSTDGTTGVMPRDEFRGNRPDDAVGVWGDAGRKQFLVNASLKRQVHLLQGLLPWRELSS